MQSLTEKKSGGFIERRRSSAPVRSDGPERRQFTDSYSSLRPEVAELAEAVDQYKLRHRRRFITFEELYDVLTGLGYHR